MPKCFVVLSGAPAHEKKIPQSLPAALLQALEPHAITAESLASVRACGGAGAHKFGTGHGVSHSLVQSGCEVPDDGVWIPRLSGTQENVEFTKVL